MAQQTINVGETPNDGSGDPLRTAFEKCNNNFTELYSTSYTPARISNGASSVNIPEGDGNIEITVNDTANTVLITQTGTYVTGFMSATGNIFGANLRTSGVMSATGNVTGGNLITNGLLQAAGNISGANVNAGANVYATTHTGVTASLSGNVQGGNLRTVGQVSATGNVISGGFFVGDGGLLSNVTVASNVAVTQIANGTSLISIAGSGANAVVSVGGSSNIAVFATSGAYITGLVSATGNVRGGNLTTGGLCQATGNVTGGNLTTAGQISSTGNIFGGNLLTSGFVLSTGNLTGGNLTTPGAITSTGNVDAGNLRTAGLVSATGNIVGVRFIGDGSQLTNINTAIIQNGSSNVTVVGSGSNVSVSIGGTSNVAVVASTGVYVTGLLSTTGNISCGNISGSNIAAINISGIITDASQTNITSVGTLTSLNSGAISSSGNVTGANLLTGGLVSATGNVSGGNLRTVGQVSATGNITSGNLSVGTGIVSVGSIVNNNANGVGNIGTSAKYFNTVFALATSAQYADLAEYYTADAEYEAGTVVKFGGEFEVTIATQDADPEVAGVISTCPAYAMNTGIEGEYTAPVALQGRVPCKVQGPVRKGQMMVSAGNGYARAESNPAIGTVIGKALENFEGGQGTIEVVVGRV